MAEVVLEVLINNLGTLIGQGFGQLWGVQEDMMRLSRMLSTIRDVLEDAEMQQITNKPLANWLNNLKQASYDADDVLDEWYTNARPAEALEGANYGISKKVCECVSSSLSLKQIAFRLNVGKKFKKIISTFNEIAAERNNFFLSQNVVSDRVQFEETSSILVEEVVYGRDGDHEKVVDILLDNVNRQESVSVLPIQGMGGLGKTTLAQMVFHDERVVKHFGDERGWVCVSDDFDVKRLTKMILEAFPGGTCAAEALEPMQRQLQEKLSGKKFLLVLDDIWNEDSDKWERLKSSLTCGVKGSWVIVTTRLITVTSVVGTVPSHMLTFLSEEDCWCLFERRAFGAGNKKTAEFVEIGKQIVRKCGGVPLAAKALGGLMCLKRDLSQWLQVRDSQIWELPQDGEGRILPALRLSYNHLPSYMRQCFSFCSVFPKDHEINKEELVHLWMANGFVQPEGRIELEDVGNLIFSELLKRSFFQDVTKDEVGNVYKCKMHDLMHDLACSVSGKECFIIEVGKGTKLLSGGVRHMSLVLDRGNNVGFNFQSVIKSNPQLRTLLLLGDGKVDISPIILNNLKCLRALDMSDIGIKLLPRKIGKMKHLRYLNLSENREVKSLPGSITKLRNLQSLKLRSCGALKVLPKHMSKMTSLRHMDMSECWELEFSRLTQMPNGLGQLTQLRTFSFFVVGPRTGSQIKELKGLNHLGGELKIRGLEHLSNTEEAKEANLISKRDLSSLQLVWSARVDGELQEKMIEEGLRPHPNLKKICITGYGGATLPTWMASLQYLVQIRLVNCDECESLPPLGRLPLLKDIYIYRMPGVKRMGDEFYGPASDLPVFPSLQKLEIWGMPNLEEWSSPSSSSANENSTQAFFPCLQDLRIQFCRKLKAFPFNLKSARVDLQEKMIEEGLRPHPNVKKIWIDGYGGATSPTWMASLQYLVEIRLVNCDECESLPPLGRLPLLKVIDIHRMPGVKRMGDEFYGPTSDLPVFPSLQNLRIWDMRNLEEWSSPSLSSANENSTQAFFPCLKDLSIWSCPKLKAFPFVPCLQDLDLSGCDDAILGSAVNLNSLRSLSIKWSDSLKSLPAEIENLTSLISLTLSDLREMETFPEELQNLTSLENFYIKNCASLKCLPVTNCASLQTLHVTRCPGLLFSIKDFQSLNSLQSLTLWQLPQLTTLPQGIRYLTMLRSLYIWDCNNMRMLSEELKQLTTLQSLHIENCHPDLHKRCVKDKGDDWHIISHIPNLSLLSDLSSMM